MDIHGITMLKLGKCNWLIQNCIRKPDIQVAELFGAAAQSTEGAEHLNELEIY